MKQTQICNPTTARTTPTAPTTLAQQPASATLRLTDIVPTAAQGDLVLLRDGEVALYKRSRSRVWQCRYKLFTGQWVRVSTRKTAYEHAVRVATDLYDEARYRERLGLAPVQKGFADIARTTVEELRRDLSAGTGKKIFVDYISIIERYFVPFFGERHLHNIKHEHIAELER